MVGSWGTRVWEPGLGIKPVGQEAVVVRVSIIIIVLIITTIIVLIKNNVIKNNGNKIFKVL